MTDNNNHEPNESPLRSDASADERQREANDRLIDWGLREVAGDEPAVDLTERILAAAATAPDLDKVSAVPSSVEKRQQQGQTRRLWLIGVAALLLLGFAGLFSSTYRQTASNSEQALEPVLWDDAEKSNGRLGDSSSVGVQEVEEIGASVAVEKAVQYHQSNQSANDSLSAIVTDENEWTEPGETIAVIENSDQGAPFNKLSGVPPAYGEDGRYQGDGYGGEGGYGDYGGYGDEGDGVFEVDVARPRSGRRRRARSDRGRQGEGGYGGSLATSGEQSESGLELYDGEVDKSLRGYYERQSGLNKGLAVDSSKVADGYSSTLTDLDFAEGQVGWGMQSREIEWEGKKAQLYVDYQAQQRTRTESYTLMVPQTKSRTETYTVIVPEKRKRMEDRTRVVDGKTETYQAEVSYTIEVPVEKQRTVNYTVQVPEMRTRSVPYPGRVVPKLIDENGKAIVLNKQQQAELAKLVEQQVPRVCEPNSSGDQYARIYENPFVVAKGRFANGEPRAVSTFSIDVDTASYSNVRKFLRDGQLPPPNAVRLEELVNYFDYDYAGPDKDGDKDSTHPFATHTEVASCPWAPSHRLVRVAIKGREIESEKRPLCNIVFLVDVSGSMNNPDKLPLVVDGLTQMTRELGENDQVAIVVYAGSEGLALPSTRGDQRDKILEKLQRLSAGGSTAGGAGITLAYKVAEENFIKGGSNRVILCTDGDFNVGISDTAALERLAETKAAETGVFLTVLGVGRGNLNDAMMEKISNCGNGTYHYLDNLREARRVLVQQLSGTLVTIAKDVKIQVEFNPANVAGYRLLGYENRMLARKDFNDDTKDAGEVGAGHTVTALYEIAPTGVGLAPAAVKEDPLKYQVESGQGEEELEREELQLLSKEYMSLLMEERQLTASLGEGHPKLKALRARLSKLKAAMKQELGKEEGNNVSEFSDELLTLRLRYKLPDEDVSTKMEVAVKDEQSEFRHATTDFRFAASVAGFGMILRDSQYKGAATLTSLRETAADALGEDARGNRAEFIELIDAAAKLR